jgi:hypothetical protein
MREGWRDFVRGANPVDHPMAHLCAIYPFTPGTHTVVLFDEFTFSGPVMLTATLHVGR